MAILSEKECDLSGADLFAEGLEGIDIGHGFGCNCQACIGEQDQGARDIANRAIDSASDSDFQQLVELVSLEPSSGADIFASGLEAEVSGHGFGCNCQTCIGAQDENSNGLVVDALIHASAEDLKNLAELKTGIFNSVEVHQTEAEKEHLRADVPKSEVILDRATESSINIFHAALSDKGEASPSSQTPSSTTSNNLAAPTPVSESTASQSATAASPASAASMSEAATHQAATPPASSPSHSESQAPTPVSESTASQSATAASPASAASMSETATTTESTPIASPTIEAKSSSEQIDTPDQSTRSESSEAVSDIRSPQSEITASPAAASAPMSETATATESTPITAPNTEATSSSEQIDTPDQSKTSDTLTSISESITYQPEASGAHENTPTIVENSPSEPVQTTLGNGDPRNQISELLNELVRVNSLASGKKKRRLGLANEDNEISDDQTIPDSIIAPEDILAILAEIKKKKKAGVQTNLENADRSVNSNTNIVTPDLGTISGNSEQSAVSNNVRQKSKSKAINSLDHFQSEVDDPKNEDSSDILIGQLIHG